MKKKVILLCIILFPSLIYLFFEMTKANFKKMAYFGPKIPVAKGDTIYYRVPDVYFTKKEDIGKDISVNPEGGEKIDRIRKTDSLLLDTANYPIYVILFLDNKLKKEGYKLAGIYDYLKYKAKNISEVPVIVVSDFSEGLNNNFEFDSLKITQPNFQPLWVSFTDRQKFLATNYFRQKPYYVLDYFMVLVDKKRNIRGYYDPTFNAEITRMIADYKHLKIRDGYAQTLRQNDIQQK